MSTTKRAKVGLSEEDKLKMKQEVIDKVNKNYDDFEKEVKDTIKGLGNLRPSGTSIEFEILAFTENKGIWVATDTGHWYYFDELTGKYTDGGVYQATEIADGSVIEEKLDSNIKNKIINNKENLITFAKERKIYLTLDNLVNNSVNSSTGQIGIESNIRVCNKYLFEVDTTLMLYIHLPSSYILMSCYGFNDSDEDGIMLPYDDYFKFFNGGAIPIYKYYRFVFSKTDYSIELTPNELIKAGLQIYQELEDKNDKKVENAVIKEIGKNLFDKSTAVSGYLNVNGVINEDSGYYTSDYIKVEEGKTYVISPYIRKFVQYDTNKIMDSDTFVDTLTSNYSFTALYDGYVRFSLLANKLDTQQMEEGNTPTAYEEFGYTLPNELRLGIKQKEQIANLGIEKKLSGKTIYTFGDSIAYGAGGFVGGFSKIIADNNEMTNTNYAVGGATITTIINSTNNVNNQIENASEVIPDFILFNGYVNDCVQYDNSVIQLGEIDYNKWSAFSSSTFTGGFEKTILQLQTKYAGARIIYVTSHRMSSRTQSTQKILHDRAIEVCAKWGIPVVDMFTEGGLNTNITFYKLAYTYDTYETGTGDGTHPNEAGYSRFYAPLIEAKMKELI